MLRLARTAPLTVVMILGLAACGSKQATTPVETAVQPPPVAQSSLERQVAAFAALASPGQSDVVTDDASGAQVRVTMVRDYQAASGRTCRRLRLAPGGDRTACRHQSGVWHLTRSIAGRRGL
ncbi:MAG: hypothetical protein Alpg2KO_31690 [Alphaproteobacteria bacterium]